VGSIVELKTRCRSVAARSRKPARLLGCTREIEHRREPWFIWSGCAIALGDTSHFTFPRPVPSRNEGANDLNQILLGYLCYVAVAGIYELGYSGFKAL